MPVSFTEEELKSGLTDLGYEETEPVSFSQTDIQPPAPQPQRQPSRWDVPGAFTQGTKEGVAGLLGAPVDIANTLMGLPMGRTSGLVPQPLGGSQSLMSAMRSSGIPDYDVQPGFASNIARLAGQQAPSLATVALGAANAGVSPTKAVATALPLEVGASVAGGTIKTLYPENEVAQIAATLAGGFGTAGAQTIAKNWVNPDLNVKINRTLNAVAPVDKSDIGILGGESLLKVQQKGIDGAKAVTVANKQAPFVYKNLEGKVIRKGLPETRFEFSEAIDQLKARLYSSYNGKQKAAGQQGLVFDGDSINNRLDSYINDLDAAPSASLENRHLLAAKKMYAGKQLTPAQLQKELAFINTRLKAYHTNPTPNQSNRASADAKIVEILRDELDSGITRFEGEGYQELRNQYGNIKALQDRIGRAAQKQLKEEANPPKPWDIGDIGIGIGTAISMTQDPLYAAIGGSLIGARHLGKYLMQPDRRIRRMFETTDKLFNPGPKFGPIPGAEERFTTKPYEGEVIPPTRDIVPSGMNRGQVVEGQYSRQRIDPAQPALPWNQGAVKRPTHKFTQDTTVQQVVPFDFNSALQSLVENGMHPVEARDMLINQIKAELSRRARQ